MSWLHNGTASLGERGWSLDYPHGGLWTMRVSCNGNVAPGRSFVVYRVWAFELPVSRPV